MTRSSRLLTLSALSLAVLSTPMLHAAAADAPSTSPALQRVVPLGRALSSFASQHGVALAFDPALTAGRRAPSVPANLPLEDGLAALLAGTGLHAVRRDDGSYTLEQPAQTSRGGTMPALRVGSTGASLFGEGMTLGQDYVQAQPAGNGDITSLLKINPAVQFDNAQLGSFNPGEISPAEISINGAKFYQNAFLVDGVSFNNDIDPAADASPYRLDSVPGGAQALALDTSLLEDITVLDSNISAAYGGFNGGVVDATTRRPSRTLSGSVSTQMARSEWTRYHLNGDIADSYNKASSYNDGQPEFKKEITRATLEGYVTDTVGLLASVTRKRSTIPSYFYSSHLVDTYGAQKETQRRASDNVFVKAVWEASDRLDLDASVTYAPSENHYFRSNSADGALDIDSGGLQAQVKANWQADWGRVQHQLSWSDTEQSRQADANDFYTWLHSASKPWGTTASSTQGEYGSIEQQSSRLQYKVDANADAFQWLGMTHRLSAGLQVAHERVSFERLEDASSYVVPVRTDTCTNRAGVTDTATCSLGLTDTGAARTTGWPGQYFSQRTRFAAGRIGFNVDSGAAYLEDDIQIGALQLRPGLRVDADSYMDQTTVAPRLAAAYQLNDAGNTRLLAGANRYYGRNAATWQLRDGVNRLRYNSERRSSLDAEWTLGTQATNQVRFNELKVAYDDEWMLGAQQQWGGFDVLFKYVNRTGRDQVIQVPGRDLGAPADDPTLSNSYTTWTNDGHSRTDIYSLVIKPLRALRWGNTYTTGMLALDWTDSRASAPDYENEDGRMYYLDPIIRYQGDFMRYRDRPADNFNRPWTARLTTMTRIPAAHLTVSNFLRYRAAFSAVADTNLNTVYEGQSVDIWEERSFSPALTWDLRLAWELPVGTRGTVFSNVDVFNLLDASNVNGVSNGPVSVPYYEMGRSFWVEVGYRF